MSVVRLLIVCHANTSRSVIAEALLLRLLEDHGLSESFLVQSGGVAPFARDGALASLDARLALRDVGIHISPETVSTDLKRNRDLVAAADVILAMTAEQVDILRRHFPEADAKAVHTLLDFAGSIGDIEDPAGQSEDVYAICVGLIRDALTASLPRLSRLAAARRGAT